MANGWSPAGAYSEWTLKSGMAVDSSLSSMLNLPENLFFSSMKMKKAWKKRESPDNFIYKNV